MRDQPLVADTREKALEEIIRCSLAPAAQAQSFHTWMWVEFTRESAWRWYLPWGTEQASSAHLTFTMYTQQSSIRWR